MEEKIDITFYLIFFYFGISLIATLACHIYLKAWIEHLYDMPIPE